MRNTKKTQAVKYPSVFMIYNIVSKDFHLTDYFSSVEKAVPLISEARDYIEGYETENFIILEYSPVAIFSPPKKVEWTREPLNE